MDVYKEIRRMRLEGHGQRWIAKRLGISRNTVRKYWDGDTVPWERKEYERNASVVTPQIDAFIQSYLDTIGQKGQRNSITRPSTSMTDW